MLQLFHQSIHAGTWLMTFVILCIVKHGSEFCRPKFCLRLIAYLLKHPINVGVVFLIGKIPVAVYLAYLVFKFCNVVCA